MLGLQGGFAFLIRNVIDSLLDNELLSLLISSLLFIHVLTSFERVRLLGTRASEGAGAGQQLDTPVL
jgi:hypothetical protein